jgi:hypothetical protein
MIREYRISPEWRRCCWYVMLSTVPLACVGIYTSRVLEAKDWLDIAPQISIFALLFVACLAALRWNLCVDNDGISRRRALFWDEWPWSDFASGRIEKPGPCALLDPTRPLGRRLLFLGWLAEDDFRTVLAEINAHYRLPSPPAVAERLAIRWGKYFRNRATLADGGLDLIMQGKSSFRTWSAVRQISIVRSDPLRRDFRYMQIEFDGTEVQLRVASGRPNWHGATAEQINEYCLKRVPAERVAISTEDEQADRGYIGSMLRDAEESRRAITICLAVFLPALMACLVFMAIEFNVLGSLIMAVFSLIMIGPLCAGTLISARNQIMELRKALESLQPIVREDNVPFENVNAN